MSAQSVVLLILSIDNQGSLLYLILINEIGIIQLLQQYHNQEIDYFDRHSKHSAAIEILSGSIGPYSEENASANKVLDQFQLKWNQEFDPTKHCIARIINVSMPMH